MGKGFIKKLMLTEKKENKIIRFGIILFWLLFWFLNVVDKIIPGKVFLWAGKDRFTQITDYFLSIGVDNVIVPQIFLSLITLLEFVAFVFLVWSLVYFIKGKHKVSHSFAFWGILVSLLIFSFFTIGDQIFGEREELLEHSIYWISLVISWYVYSHSGRSAKRK